MHRHLNFEIYSQQTTTFVLGYKLETIIREIWWKGRAHSITRSTWSDQSWLSLVLQAWLPSQSEFPIQTRLHFDYTTWFSPVLRGPFGTLISASLDEQGGPRLAADNYFSWHVNFAKGFKHAILSNEKREDLNEVVGLFIKISLVKLVKGGWG